MGSATIAEAMNSVVARIDALSHPPGKNSFVDAVRSCNGDRTMLAAFARQYHFFSLMQASLLPLLIECFEATDVVARADLSQILADEYGNGDPARVHSEIFKQFARSVGVNVAELPIAENEVVPGIRSYLAGI